MNIKWVGFLRIVIGIYFLAHGINRVDWFSSSEFLRAELKQYEANPHPAAQWVQKHVADPYVEIWARVIPAGAMLFGAALIAGFLSRTALIVSIVLTLLYHTVKGTVFSPLFITDPSAMLFIASLTTLTFLRSGSVFAVKRSRR
jgi:uncharacterized membrane protein YphA (DoxX/SURF4 family)